MASRQNPFLKEVYDVIKDIPGVMEIDGRSASIHYMATVIQLAAIIEALTETYGAPTEDHPLIGHVTWHLGDRHIVVNKAQFIVGQRGTYHQICAW